MSEEKKVTELTDDHKSVVVALLQYKFIRDHLQDLISATKELPTDILNFANHVLGDPNCEMYQEEYEFYKWAKKPEAKEEKDGKN